MRADKAERILTWLLRVLAVLLLTAVIPMVMPTEWMSDTNDWLGLEPLHRSPLTEYLTRSLSAIYALFGALTLWIAGETRRYAGFIAFMGKLTVLLGVFFTGLDTWAGMPSYWTWAEGPQTMILGLVIVWLARRVEQG